MRQIVEIVYVNENTDTGWTNFAREVMTKYITENSVKIVREHEIIEIDELEFGRHKNHKGRVIEGTWIFGGANPRAKSQCFFVPVVDRSKTTLLKK